MARYTLTLAQYLAKGGTLPASFAEIDGFEDTFKLKYTDCEIGQETENAFTNKLELIAKLKIPLYKSRIEQLASAWGMIDTNARVIFTTANATMTAGAQKTKITDLPINASVATPNTITDVDASTNGNTSEQTTRESGYTSDELLRKIDFLNKEVADVTEKLLKEFKLCFMGLYL